MHLYSSEFLTGTSIPFKYTCDGENLSPPLTWEDPPPGTQSFALIVSDPDAPNGTFTHWVLYNLPADLRRLPESIPNQHTLPNGSRQGKNDFEQIGFGGPCPPNGNHRYFFKLHALDRSLDLAPGASSEDVLQAMDGHVLDAAELMGLYGRANF
jgi:Raf kinase inhibitor-like YbhB/YbcL family protein